ncbi:unnamed protein product [Cochlearia groenlandica]
MGRIHSLGKGLQIRTKGYGCIALWTRPVSSFLGVDNNYYCRFAKSYKDESVAAMSANLIKKEEISSELVKHKPREAMLSLASSKLLRHKVITKKTNCKASLRNKNNKKLLIKLEATTP